MSLSATFLVVALIALVGTTGLFLYRLQLLRGGGTSALVRQLPANPDRGWHHGLIRYGEDGLKCFRLSSLRFGPDLQLDRQTIEVERRRRPTSGESDLMSAGTVIVVIRQGDRELEFAFDSGAVTAFSSWVESRPSGRSRRNRPS